MPVSRPARWAVPGTAAAIVMCAALAGCGSTSSSTAGPSGSSASAGSSATGQGSASGVKLTGNFCTDFKNIGQDIELPPSAQGSLSAAQKHAVPYLQHVAAYFNGLANEADPQARQELHVIAADYQAMASSIASGSVQSMSKIEQKMLALTSKGSSGTAFRQLFTYVATKCA